MQDGAAGRSARGALDRVSQAARVLLGLILLAMVLLNVVNAFTRYALSYVVIGIDELLVFAMIWMVMVGMLLVTADRSHIALEIITGRVGPRARAGLALLHHSIIAVTCACVAWQSYKFVSRVIAIHQTSMALELPMWIPHGAITIGLTGTALIAVVLAWRDLCALVSPRHVEQVA